MNIQSGQDNTLIEQAHLVRRTVFIEEQGIDPALEYDTLDSDCFHVVLFEATVPVATARLRPIGDGIGKVERVATIQQARGKGYAQAVMRHIEEMAEAQGLTTLKLGAQLTALSFYKRLGYEPYGEPFVDANLPHRMMQKTW